MRKVQGLISFLISRQFFLLWIFSISYYLTGYQLYRLANWKSGNQAFRWKIILNNSNLKIFATHNYQLRFGQELHLRKQNLRPILELINVEHVGQKDWKKMGDELHEKAICNYAQVINKPAIRCFTLRGGVNCIVELICEETRDFLRLYFDNVIRDDITYAEYAKRKTVMNIDVVQALKIQSRNLYGFKG